PVNSRLAPRPSSRNPWANTCRKLDCGGQAAGSVAAPKPSSAPAGRTRKGPVDGRHFGPRKGNLLAEIPGKGPRCCRLKARESNAGRLQRDRECTRIDRSGSVRGDNPRGGHDTPREKDGWPPPGGESGR